MEGVPRMPMLHIELKQNSIDFSSLDWAGMPSAEDYYDSIQLQTMDALKKHIRDEYGDNPEKFEGAIHDLLAVQLAAYKAMPSPDFEGCTTIKKYFGQLHYMQSRFPFKGENGLKVLFAWQDAFTGFLTEHDSLEFEQTAVLFNIGAIHSILGSADTRVSEEGIRISCVHFQCAAGVFAYLAENFDTTLSPDISQFMLKLYINLSLAQGQECLLEKSMQDNRKSSIVSKICQQVVDYYKQCLQSLENKESNSALGNSAHKEWKKMVYFKVQYYSAIAKYFMGNSALDQDKYGQSVSYFGAGVAHLNELTKLVKGFPKEIRTLVDTALRFTFDVLNGKYNSAVKDNNFVYHDKVPDPATLPEAKGATLVKALPYEPANETITGPDFFAKLVPMEAHLAASSYSEEKAKLLRSVVATIDEKNAVIDQYKSSIDLDPKKIIDPNQGMKLDLELIEKCALLNTDQTPIDNLKEHMNVLNDVYSELDSVLNDILGIVEKEESEDLKLKETAEKEAFSVQDDIEGIRKELSVYTELHQKAGQMNEDLQTACRIHIQNMKVVANGIAGVEEDLKLKDMLQLISEEDKSDIELIRKLCNKVIEMEQQRQSLLEQLRQQMDSDDVTSALVTKHGIDQDDLFKEELKKYDTLISTINQNLAAQDNIFDAVTEANARYTKIRKVIETEKERIAQRTKNLVLSCTIASDVSSRCNEGKKFFGEILTKAKGLYDRVREFQEENEEKRIEIYKKIEEKKKPPPRPSAPKPKLKAPPEKKDNIGSLTSKPGMILSPEVLAKMMAEDDDELLNDPEFLQFLQNQDDLQKLPGVGPVSPSFQSFNTVATPGVMSRPGSIVPATPRFSRPTISAPPGPAISHPMSSAMGIQSYRPRVIPVDQTSLNQPPMNQPQNISLPPPSVSQPGVSQHLPSTSLPVSTHAVPQQLQQGNLPAIQVHQIQRPSQPGFAHGMALQYQQDGIPVQQSALPKSDVMSHGLSQQIPHESHAAGVPLNQMQRLPQSATANAIASQYQQVQPNSQYPSVCTPQPTSSVYQQNVPQQIQPSPMNAAPHSIHYQASFSTQTATQLHGQGMRFTNCSSSQPPSGNYHTNMLGPSLQSTHHHAGVPPVQAQPSQPHQVPQRLPTQTPSSQTIPSQFSNVHGQSVAQPIRQQHPNYQTNVQVSQQVSVASQQMINQMHPPIPQIQQQPRGNLGYSQSTTQVQQQHINVNAYPSASSGNTVSNPSLAHHIQPHMQYTGSGLVHGPVQMQQATVVDPSTQYGHHQSVRQPINAQAQSVNLPSQVSNVFSGPPGQQSSIYSQSNLQSVRPPFNSHVQAANQPSYVGNVYAPSAGQQSNIQVVHPPFNSQAQSVNQPSQVGYSVPVGQQNTYSQPNPYVAATSGIATGQTVTNPPMQQQPVLRTDAISSMKSELNQYPSSAIQSHGNQAMSRMQANPTQQYAPTHMNQQYFDGQYPNQGAYRPPQMMQPSQFSTPNSFGSDGPVRSNLQGIQQAQRFAGNSGNHIPPQSQNQPVPNQMQATVQPTQYRPVVPQQYGAPVQSSVSNHHIVRPPAPSSYSVAPRPTHPPNNQAATAGGNRNYPPEQKPVQDHMHYPNVAQSVMSQPANVSSFPPARAVISQPAAVSRFPQQPVQLANANMIVGSHQRPVAPATGHAPSDSRTQNPGVQMLQQNTRAPSSVPQRYESPLQPEQQGNYTFRSQPHVGSLTATPSNENSPKHVIKQTNPGVVENQSAGILKPTPVGAKGANLDQDPSVSKDLAGLVLTPRRTLSSSADELLLSAPEQTQIMTKDSQRDMLIPTKVDEVDEKMVVRPVEGLPYMDEADLMHFKIQVSEFRGKVTNLLNKPAAVQLCELDKEWKQLSESQEIHSRKLSTAIARCSSYKNRYQDVVPFDQSRVVLKAAKDDYVNASVIDGISPYCPRFIAAQSPLQNTVADFWLMVYEQQVNILVMLVNSKDIPKKCPVYWPTDRTVPQQYGPLTVSFTTSKTHGDLYIERTFTIKHKSQSLAISVIQLQYIVWPEHRQRSSESDVLSFVRVVQSFHSSQRNLQRPVLVHCESGVGRTGVFCSFFAAINEINAGMGIIDVVDVVSKMRLKRKYMVQEKAQLKFVYDIILYHAVDILKQRNVVLEDECRPVPLPTQASNNSDVGTPKSSNFDIFSNQSALSSIQATVEKMTLKTGHEHELPASTPSFSPHVEGQILHDINTNTSTSMHTDQSSYTSSMPMTNAPTTHTISEQKFVDMSDLIQGTMGLVPNVPRFVSTPSQVNAPKPDVVESCNNIPGIIPDQTRVDYVHQYADPPSSTSLLDSMTPESFTLNLEENVAKKQRISKADFFKPQGSLHSETDASDPFSGLDPLWGLRK